MILIKAQQKPTKVGRFLFKTLVQYHILPYFVPLRFIKLIDNDFSIIYKGYKMEDGRKTTAGKKG
jgi:hypothetical protein